MKRGIIFSIFFTLVFAVQAQSSKEKRIFSRLQPVVADGELNEWSTLYTMGGADSTWAFDVGTDGVHLCLAVRIKDPVLQMEAVRHGIRVNIHPDGKKKDGMKLLYPVPDAESVRALLQEGNLSAAQIRAELISRSRGYLMKAFPRVIDGLLALDNSYGVKAVLRVDAQDRLVYESVIPIELLALKKNQHTIAVQVSLENRWTEMQKAMARRQQTSPYYPYGMMGMRPSAQVKAPFKGKTEAWVVDTL